ncbi:putative short-chain dehydrogenase [Xylaria sp. FL0043]|nr:putative short-chain dehydrogenase [Xylaria sp. FL0043]
MAGTILFTGANGSSGAHAAGHLLKTYPQYTAIFTVRDASDDDLNTRNLREVISRHPNSHASIHQLDLASLDSVHGFATELSSAIESGQYPPLKAIVANAFYWDLVGDSEFTVDSFDKTIQISHIVAHFRKKTRMSPYLPDLPADLDELLRPCPDKDKQGRGFQRYSNAKLLITTWIYPLNGYLSLNPKFQNITAIAVNPGGLGDSRCFRTNAPRFIQFMARFVPKPLIPVINRLADPTFRSSVEVGYFTLLKNDESDSLTLNLDMQTKVWKKSAEWARITKENTALADGL